MATMTTLEFIKSRANIEKVEYEDGCVFIYLTDHEDSDGKYYYLGAYLQEYICDVLGKGWYVMTECNSDGDEIPVGICKLKD